MSAKTDMEAKDMYYEALEVRQAPDSAWVVWSLAASSPRVPESWEPAPHPLLPTPAPPGEQEPPRLSPRLPVALHTLSVTLLKYLEIRATSAPSFYKCKTQAEGDEVICPRPQGKQQAA